MPFSEVANHNVSVAFAELLKKIPQKTLYTSYLPLPGHIQCLGRVQMSNKYLNPQIKLN